MRSFNLKIVSFDNVLLDEPVVYCAIQTDKGKIGFKARHEAFVSTLKENSRVEYEKPSGEKGSLEVRNGLFAFRDNSCVLTVYET